MSGFVPLGLLPKEAVGQVAGALAQIANIYSMRCSCHEYRMLAMGLPSSLPQLTAERSSVAVSRS